MTHVVAQVALGNLVMSGLIATLAWALDRSGRSPSLAHALWVLVLVKVLTPPLLTLPLLPAAGASPVAATESQAVDARASDLLAGLGGAVEHVLPWALAAWAIGSLVVLVISLLRIRRFDGLVRHSSAPASPAVRSLAASAAARLGLRSAPDVVVTHAWISPMTWWTGGRIRIVLPAALCHRFDDDGLRWVLGHELAHVKRRDHVVRWLEWLACVAFWWNPVVWLARHNLRHDEEASCDALVIDRLGGRPQAYARTLLAVVELLAQPAAARPPAVATGIDAGGRLERRFSRIVAADPRRAVPRRVVAGLLGSALVLMTLGIGSAGVPSSGAAMPMTAADEPTPPRSKADTSDRAPAATAESSEGFRLLSGRAAGILAAPHLKVGDAGRDELRGGRGPDLLVGRGGRDRLAGGRGADILRGGRGDDVLIGGPGPDIIHGGAGNDVVRAWQDGAPDRIDCGAGEGDRAIIDASDTTVGCEVVIVR